MLCSAPCALLPALLRAPSWEQCHHVGQSWAGAVPHGGDGAHGLLPQLCVQAVGGLLLQQLLRAQWDGMGWDGVVCPAWWAEPGHTILAPHPNSQAPQGPRSGKGCAQRPALRCSPYLNALCHL